mmetsp:Transcript_5839/g.36208  ORF Transcript_5839/g.36208 Transcript_5839/m.36208 type:complete len:301 (-) Transcript_5839:1523-2425(-)
MEAERRAIRAAARRVLRCADPDEKARLTKEFASAWRNGTLDEKRTKAEADEEGPPKRPCRDARVRVVKAHALKRRGKAGSLASRRAIVHGLVHVESWAVDLAWDAVARFGRKDEMPKAFYDDFVTIAEDEARHFCLLQQRLKDMGAEYGDLEEHDGLWESAEETSHSLAARLAVEHCTHEARGMDVLPITIARFRNAGDHETADVLEKVVYPEEIGHCKAGVRWFKYLHERGTVCLGDGTPVVEEAVCKAFHRVVRKHFKGSLKPPFNEKARREAGFEPSWYLPLVEDEIDKQRRPQKHY